VQFLMFFGILMTVAGTVNNIEQRFFKSSNIASWLISMALFALPLRYLNDSFYYNSVNLIVEGVSKAMSGWKLLGGGYAAGISFAIIIVII